MAISGKSSLSIKKADLKNQKNPAIGFKSLRFWHKATGGETGIDLTALTFPSSELPNESNPTSSEIVSAKLLFNKPNLTIKSSVRGVLLQSSYSIPHNSRVNFEGFTADVGEVFEFIVHSKAETGLRVVDASPVVATGTLLANTTDFAVGTPFELNKYPNEQVGAILVYIDGLLQYRNVGNAAAAPTADGNYEEVDSGDGKTSNLIRFNVSDTVDRDIVVISNGLLVSQPDDSRDAALNSLSASVDIMIDDLAAATGNPASKYQAAPSQVDLKQFGNKVFDLERRGKTTKIITGAYTANLGEDLMVDVSSSALTITLPAAPKIGDVVIVRDYKGNAATNNITVDNNGKNIEGQNTTYLIDVDRGWAEFIYSDATEGWIIRGG